MPELSQFSIPVPGASSVLLRYSPLPRSGGWNPGNWPHVPLANGGDGWWRVDVSQLGLAPGAYEYEFVINRDGGSFTAPDPYAEEITRFSGYRSVLRIGADGKRMRLPFSWDGELPPLVRLPNNNEIVIYELPMRWIDPGDDGYDRQVGLGTFEKALFEHLDQHIVPLGVNCIELLPIQDSADTLNWGYGTRFFLAPDLDMGEPFDLKLFIKACHQRGIRVIFDLVMNHARSCPLERLAFSWFFLAKGSDEPDPKGDPRPDWGGKAFRYRTPEGSAFQARNFHFDVAAFLIREFHADGFRLDEFKGIDCYDFIQDFTDRAHAVFADAFPDRPFLVIAEDSWRRRAITNATHRGRRVVDAMWDFDFRDDVRRCLSDTMQVSYGQQPRSDRIRRLLTVGQPALVGGDATKTLWDLAHRVAYCTSHDVAGPDEQRLYSYFLMKRGLPVPGDGWDVDRVTAEQIISTFALTLTAAGIPMFLCGEEFADRHDLPRDGAYKMSDPVDWGRASQPMRTAIRNRVAEMIRLRTTHPALRRNELAFFGFGGGSGFHPTFDGIAGDNDGERLFAFCRTNGQALGQPGQVVVVANASTRDYPEVRIDWPWGYRPSLHEHGGKGQDYPYLQGAQARLAMAPYQCRVFSV